MLGRSMWRSAALGRAASMGRRAAACARIPPSPRGAAFGAPMVPPRPGSCAHQRHLPERTTLLWPPVFFRGYARMRRRSPPQRPPEESESETETEVDDYDLPAEEKDKIDCGDEPVEWEGYEIRFGSAEGDTDEEEDVP